MTEARMDGSDDESGSEPDSFGYRSGNRAGGEGEWQVVRNKKSRRLSEDGDSSGGGAREEIVKRRKEEYLILIQFESESAGVLNPIKMTSEIKTTIGSVTGAKMLRGGKLLITCKDESQRDKALKMKYLGGKKVMTRLFKEKQWLSGVINGVPFDVSMEQLKQNISGGNVKEAVRLKGFRNGVKEESLSVMIRFDGNILPDRVYLGYISFPVRVYVPPPIRCFNCQRYGHIAAACRGKKRCGVCGGEHEYGHCEEGVKPKCCNCGGDHKAAYGGCEVRKRAAEVQQIRIKQGISYAEALKEVGTGDQKKGKDVRSARTVSDVPRTDLSHKPHCPITQDTLVIDKVKFVMFMADVVNCTAQTNSRTERIKIIVRSAEKLLDIKGITWEVISSSLAGKVIPTQSSKSS